MIHTLSALVDYVTYSFMGSDLEIEAIAHTVTDMLLRARDMQEVQLEVFHELQKTRLKKPILLNYSIVYKFLVKHQQIIKPLLDRKHVLYDFHFLGQLLSHPRDLEGLQFQFEGFDLVKEWIVSFKQLSPNFSKDLPNAPSLKLSTNYLHIIVNLCFLQYEGLKLLLAKRTQHFDQWIEVLNKVAHPDYGITGIIIPLAYKTVDIYFSSKISTFSEAMDLNLARLLSHILTQWDVPEVIRIYQAIENETYGKTSFFDYHEYLLEFQQEISDLLPEVEEAELEQFTKLIHNYGEFALDLYGPVIAQIYQLHTKNKEIENIYKLLLLKNINYQIKNYSTSA